LKRSFWSHHWRAFAESYDPDEVLGTSNPAAVAFVFFTFAAVVVVPAYVEPLASIVQFRHPWIPILSMGVAAVLSITASRHQLRGTVGAACTLVDTAFSLGAFQLAAVLTAPPASYAYSVVAGLVVLASQSRLFALTLPFALAVCLPLGAIPLVLFADPPILIIAFSSCVLALWSSYMTRTAMRLRRQNTSLVTALQTADEIVDHNRQIVLAGILLDVGYFVHELRNAQSAISVNIAYLLKENPSGDELAECLRELDDSNRRLQQVSDDVLAMLKRRDEATCEETFDVSDALRSLPSHDSGAQVVRPGRCVSIQVCGVQQDLAGALRQLIRNARQAGAKNVFVEARPCGSGAAVELTVEDDGPGIPESEWARLFKPFGRDRRAKEGLGLGLYLTQKRIELMGGRIRIESSSKGGARFVVELPSAVRSDEPKRARKGHEECSEAIAPQLD
jgi:signal transduction histidine kinase